MAVQRAQRHAVTAAELTPAHPARPVQTCQPHYLRSATTTNHRSKLSAHNQSSSQILSNKQVRSSDAYCQSAVKYGFVYVDQESFEKYKATSFQKLIDGFKEYQLTPE